MHNNISLSEDSFNLYAKCREFEFQCFNSSEYQLCELTKDLDPDNNVYSNFDRHCKYYAEERFTSEVSVKNGIGIIHINCRSLKKNFEGVKTLISTSKVNFDVIALSETWLSENEVIDYQLDNYNVVSVCRNSRGGGVMLYIRDCFDYKVVDKYCLVLGDILECVTVDIIIPGAKNITAMCCYRPPHTNIRTFNENLSPLLDDLKGKSIMLCGDFNINLLNYDTCPGTKEYLDTLYSFGLFPLIDKPTRITLETATLIDNVFTNILSDSKSGIIVNGDISDHLPVFSLVYYRGVSDSSKPVYKLSRCVNNSKLELIKSDLKMVDWSGVYSSNTIDEAYDNMVKLVKSSVDKHCPIKKVIQNSNNNASKPWLTKGIIKACRRKNRLYYRFVNNRTQENECRYKRYKAVLSNVIAGSKKNYIQTSLQSVRNDTKGTWKVINGIIKTSFKRSVVQDKFLSSSNQEISNPQDIASNFNHFFVNVGPNLASKIVSGGNGKNPVDNIPINNKSIYINPTDKVEVLNIVRNFKGKTSTDYLDFNMSLIKNIITEIIDPFTFICNMSLETGTFPNNMKTAKVVPLFKSGCKKTFSNYRPISLLPQFSKILEKLYSKRLVKFLDKYKILCESQFGFRNARSTALALGELIEEVTDSIDNQDFTLGVFIDLKKAFDTIDHTILLAKLERIGIRGTALSWLSNYLKNRQQFVKYNGCNSNLLSISTGVPQGSILGPILFLIYINDLCNVSNILKFILFADDTNIFCSGKNINNLCSLVEKELFKVNEWFKLNKLSLNVSKTNFIIFSRKSISNNVSLSINSYPLTRVYSTKFLGVIIDSNLNWKSHISYVNSKLSKCVSILFKVNSILNEHSLRLLYYTLFYPHITYCVEIWGTAYSSSINSIIVNQKKAVRAIFRVSRFTPSAPLFHRLNILRFDQLVKFKISIFLFKVLHNQLPVQIQQRYSMYAEIRRHSPVFKHVYCRTKLKSQCISICGPKIFNSLPIAVKFSTSISLFKRLLRLYLFE